MAEGVGLAQARKHKPEDTHISTHRQWVHSNFADPLCQPLTDKKTVKFQLKDCELPRPRAGTQLRCRCRPTLVHSGRGRAGMQLHRCCRPTLVHSGRGRAGVQLHRCCRPILVHSGRGRAGAQRHRCCRPILVHSGRGRAGTRSVASAYPQCAVCSDAGIECMVPFECNGSTRGCLNSKFADS